MTRASQSLEAFEVSEVSGHYIDTWATPADVRKSTLFFSAEVETISEFANFVT